MADLPHPWSAYARLQADLSRNGHRIGDQTWGMEVAMSRVLASLQDNHPLSDEEIGRSAASARRRERYRARLRFVHGVCDEEASSSEEVFAAQQALRVAEAKVSVADWTLLCEVAGGRGYDELAGAMGEKPGTLRVRVLRLRRQLAKAA